jgi:dTMP kinase
MLIPGRGSLITIEGIDGAGKSTQVELLAEHLRTVGFDVVQLREPTDGPWGRKIKELARKGRTISPREECEWFLKDRKEDVEKNILPALNENKIVLLDRYYYSTMAYQGALGLSMEAIKNANEKFAPVPDMVIIIDLSPSIALKRIEHKRIHGPDHFESLDYQEKVRKIFQEMKGHSNVRLIDGNKPVEEIHAEIKKVVLDLLVRTR